MIASNANTQIAMPVSSNSDNTNDTHWERIRLYKKLITTQQQVVFVSKCHERKILLNSNKRRNTPIDLCLILQKRRLDKEI